LAWFVYPCFDLSVSHIYSFQSDPFIKLVEEYAPKMGLDPSKAVLMGKECHYALDKTPESEGFSEDNLIEMDLLEAVKNDGGISLKVLTKEKRPFTVKFQPVTI